MVWAVLSGIEGNLAAYEAVLGDLMGQNQLIEQLFVLGDVVGPSPGGVTDNVKLVQRLQSPKPGEPTPEVCQGWWEEQVLILHAMGREGEPSELIERYGSEMVTQLWEAVPRQIVPWISQLEFGMMELDCLFIHGSPVAVDEELLPETSPLRLMDRLQRVQANRLFCGRSGQSFCCEIEAAQITQTLQQLDQQETQQIERPSVQKVIGVGSVGRSPGKASYVLYEPGSDQLQFKTVHYGAAKGFG